MAATVVIQEANGATPTWSTLVTSNGNYLARFCTADEYHIDTIGNNYPITVPTNAANNPSYWKTWTLQATGVTAGGYIKNVKINGNGDAYSTWGYCYLYLGYDHTLGGLYSVDAYDQADAATTMVEGHSEVTTRVNFDTVTSPAYIDTVGITADGRLTKYVVMQAEVSTQASSGIKSGITITWTYDEV